jgi:hypothetical protein
MTGMKGRGDLVASIADGPAVFFGSRHRWVSLVVGVLVQLCAGTLYSVTAWGVPLKEAAGWASDESLNLAETCGTLGVYVAIHNGLLLDRVGARRTMVLGRGRRGGRCALVMSLSLPSLPPTMWCNQSHATNLTPGSDNLPARQSHVADAHRTPEFNPNAPGV